MHRSGRQTSHMAYRRQLLGHFLGVIAPVIEHNRLRIGPREDGLERLARSAETYGPLSARDSAAKIGLLESTHYLRNQLLRDSDWASMAHSLELRTPLVDAQLLRALGPLTTSFTQGRGKALLARSPHTAIPRSITQRRKTGFSVPMVGWIAEAAGQQLWANTPLLSHPETPWARRWAFALQQQDMWRSA